MSLEDDVKELKDSMTALLKRHEQLAARLAVAEGGLVPVGTVVPFGGSPDAAAALREQGWWICDGRAIDDPESRLGAPNTPNLTEKFVRGGSNAGATGGSPTLRIPALQVHTLVDGFSGPVIHQDPRCGIYSNLSWVDLRPLSARGTTTAVDLPSEPPWYSLIYLIKVR